MKSRSFEEWVKIYEKKSKEEFHRCEAFHMLFLPDRGFCEIRPDYNSSMMMVYQVCGDGRYWRSVVEPLAQMLGLHYMGTIIVRHVGTFIRWLGFDVIEDTVLEDGSHRYVAIDGERKARFSPAWWKKDGELAYYMTWELPRIGTGGEDGA